jgi:hypothetical protein
VGRAGVGVADAVSEGLLSRNSDKMSSPPRVSPAAEKLQRRGERLFFAGVLLMSTVFLGPVGVPLVIWGALQMRAARRLGASPSVPWHVALVGGFTIGDASANFLGWSIDLFAGRAVISATSEHIYGTVFDGGYLHGINTTHLGDIVLGGVNTPGEKALIVGAVLVVWPCRLAAAWGFMKAKPWALGWMITTTWMMVAFWTIWLTNAVIDTENRYHSYMGVVGWFMFNGVYFIGPILMIPYLYLVDHRPWLRKAHEAALASKQNA